MDKLNEFATKLMAKEIELKSRTMGIEAPMFGGRKWRQEVGLNSPQAEAWAIAVAKEKLLLMFTAAVFGWFARGF